MQDYNCSVDFIRSIFLVKELIRESKSGAVDTKLRLDELDGANPAYQTADIVVFNIGHWWTHPLPVPAGSELRRDGEE